jgi:hypothetical protein
MRPEQKDRAVKLYVVYYQPRDYPDSYVVRGFEITTEGPVPDPVPLTVVAELVEARRAVFDAASGSVRVERYPDDDPVLVEVWL